MVIADPPRTTPRRDPGSIRRHVVSASLIMCLLGPSFVRAAAEIPKVYYLGDCKPATSPINIVADDPALDVVAVPAVVGSVWWTAKEVARALRLYMPKNYEQLVRKKVLILLSDVKAENLPGWYIDWFSKAVRDKGNSLMMFGGVSSFGGQAGSPSAWGQTSVGEILPVDLIREATGPGPWRPVVTSPDDPLMSAFPWGNCPAFYGYNKVTVKDGAQLLAKTSNTGDPFMVVWDVGLGRSFAFCTDWTPDWGKSFQLWDHYIDFCVYSIYYTMGRSIPENLELVHVIRSEMLENRVRTDILISLLAFIDDMGGRVLPLENRMREAGDIRREADDQYVLQDYEACLNTIKDANLELEDIERAAVKAKATAMIWVWAVEWMVVTATLMIAGMVVWTLMVRRGLYREAATTRTL